MMGPLDRYTCEQVLHLLDGYVDRELTPEETQRVEAHLATCVECASEERFERSLLDGLKAKIRTLDVPRSAVEKVEAILARQLDEEAPDPGDD